MIKVHCRTNLDNFKSVVWPKQFCCRPVIGDFVQTGSGVRLKICEITHSQRQVNFGAHSGDGSEYEPILIIELNER